MLRVTSGLRFSSTARMTFSMFCAAAASQVFLLTWWTKAPFRYRFIVYGPAATGVAVGRGVAEAEADGSGVATGPPDGDAAAIGPADAPLDGAGVAVPGVALASAPGR